MKDGRGPAEADQSAAVRGNVLTAMRAKAEKVSELVLASAEPGRGSGTLETPHGPAAAFQAAVILFQSVPEVAAGPVSDAPAQLGADRIGVAVVVLGCDPVRG